jgi:hypothetical protein
MVAVDSDSFVMWLKRNPVVLLFVVICTGIMISFPFFNVYKEFSTGESIIFLVCFLCCLISLYFGIEMLAMQQEINEIRVEIFKNK